MIAGVASLRCYSNRSGTRLSDAGALTKGLNRSTLLGQVTALVPTLEKVAAAHTSSSKHHPYSVYLASNRPGEVCQPRGTSDGTCYARVGIFGIHGHLFATRHDAERPQSNWDHIGSVRGALNSNYLKYSRYLGWQVEALLPTLRGIFGVRFQVYSWKQVAPHVFPLQPIG